MIIYLTDPIRRQQTLTYFNFQRFPCVSLSPGFPLVLFIYRLFDWYIIIGSQYLTQFLCIS